MNIIVVGCGRVGSHLATLLSDDGHNVSVIDRRADSFAALGHDFNGTTVKGVGFDEEVLQEAGVEDCDVVAAVTSNDNTNLMVAEVARRIFGVKHVITRLYAPKREKTYTQLGIDFACGSVGIEVKKGRPDGRRLRIQLARYLEQTQLTAMIVVLQQPCHLPESICEKPVHVVALNRLWGVALH